MFLITGSSVIMLAATVCSLQMEVIIDATQANGEINLFLSIWLGCMVIISFLAYFIYFRCLRIEEEKADKYNPDDILKNKEKDNAVVNNNLPVEIKKENFLWLVVRHQVSYYVWKIGVI